MLFFILFVISFAIILLINENKRDKFHTYVISFVCSLALSLILYAATVMIMVLTEPNTYVSSVIELGKNVKVNIDNGADCVTVENASADLSNCNFPLELTSVRSSSDKNKLLIKKETYFGKEFDRLMFGNLFEDDNMRYEIIVNEKNIVIN